MSLQDIISNGLSPFLDFAQIESGVSVKTHCLYPSNATVTVSVRGGPGGYVVMDDGRAMREAAMAGADIPGSLKKYEKIAYKQGLLLSNGIVKSPQVSAEVVPAAIILVANASKELADYIFSTWKSSNKRDFKESVRLLLSHDFPGVRVEEEKFSGESNKVHTFDNVIKLRDGSRLIIDPVLRDANSINARVIAHLDLKKANLEAVEQRIVFDDEKEKWQSNELAVLQFSGVPIIPFSKMSSNLEILLKAA